MTELSDERTAPLRRGGGDDWERYLAQCTDYIRRQVIVYRNWPQRRYDALGYRDEKVFTDRNA